MNPQAVAFSPRSQQSANLNPLAKLFSTGDRPCNMLDPAAKPSAPETLPISNLNPQTMPFYPAGRFSSSASESETSTTSPTLSACSNLNPLASDFTPSVPTFSTSLDPTAPTFAPGLDADASVIPIAQESLTATEEPLGMDFQSAPTDEVIFAEGSDNPGAIVNIGSSLSEPPAMEYPMADDSDTDNEVLPEPLVYAENVERKSQGDLMQKYPEIHHFNWLGRGIMAKTSTPAAVSLTVALTPPKGRIVDGDNLKDKTILQEAMLAVDPVVYYGDINEIRHLTGESMREAAIGATAVFYTPFGQWVNDSYEEDEEQPVEDELDVTRCPEDVSVINGWVPFHDAPTRQNFWDEAEATNKSTIAVCQKAIKERKLYGAGNTRLRNAVTAEGSELTIPAKRVLSGDASGLVTLLTNAHLHREGTATFSAHLLTEKDNCSPDAKRVDNLDEEAELVAVNRTPAVVVDDHLTKNGNCTDDRDDENKSVAIVGAPSAVVDNGLFKNSNWADDVDEEDEEEPVAIDNASSVVVDDGLYKNANWADDLDDEEDFVAASEPPSNEQAYPTTTPAMSNKEALEMCEEPPVLATLSDTVLSTDMVKSNKPVANFRPVISGTGGVRFVPVVPIPQQLQVQLEPESAAPALVVPSTELPPHAFSPGNWEELEDDDDDLYGSGPANISSDSSSTEESFTSSSCSSSSSLELFAKPAVADESGALEPRSQEEIDEEDDFCYGPPGNATKLDENLMPKPLSLPLRQKMAESLPTQTFNLPFRPRAVEVVEEVKEAKAPSDDNQRSALQVMAEQTKSDSAAESPSGSWDTSPAIFSSLGRKKGRSPIKMRSVASDHKNIAIPKLNLVPASLAVMLTSEGAKHPHRLGEIEEEVEEEDKEVEEPELPSSLETNSEQAREENKVNAKVEEAVAMGHVLLKRSPFCENLPALLPIWAEEDSDSAPVTPERALVPSACERPTSLTPDAMLRKNLQFSLPYDDENACSREQLTDGTGIGAIFEDDDEDGGDDKTSILSGTVVHEADPAYHHASLAAPACPTETNMGTNSGSASQVAEIFTASSVGTSAPTTVERSEEGSPSPEIIPRPAKRHILVAERVSAGDVPVVDEPTLLRATKEERKTGWANTIKGSFGKKPYDGFTDAAKVQFTPTRRRVSSWTKIQHKLQKPEAVVADQQEKKEKKSGFRKALKKVKNAFVKTVKALA